MGEQTEDDESLILTDAKAGLQAVFGFRHFAGKPLQTHSS